MAISFGTVGTAAAADNASVTPTMPSVSAGNIIAVFATARGNGTLGCTGYTQYFQDAHSSSGINKIALFWKVAAGGDANPTVTYTGGASGDTVIAEIVVISGADTTTPFVEKGTVASNGSQANIGSISGISIASNNAVIVFGHRADDWTSVGTLSGDSLTWNEISDAGKSTLGADAGQVWDYALVASTTTVTSKTFTVTGGSANPGLGVMVEVALASTTAYKDVSTRLRLAVQNFINTATRFRLQVQTYKDVSTRFRLSSPLTYKDVATRLRLAGRGYKDVATRYRLQVQTYKDASTRFRLSGPLTYQDVATRLRLSGQGYADAATRFRLLVQTYKDVATRFRLQLGGYIFTSTRFNLLVQKYIDVATRFKLQVQQYSDVATRFVLIVPNDAFMDVATRVRIAAQAFEDTWTRFRLAVQQYVDVDTRFRLMVTNYVFVATRFNLHGSRITDVQMRFRLQLDPSVPHDVSTRMDITARRLGA